MNPGTVTEEKLKSYKRAGVNRLSIGLQSVKNENLRLLGRIHTYEMCIRDRLITVVSRLCGIQTPVNMLFFIGICFLLVIIFSLSTALSRNSEKLKRLTQEMGLLEERLRNIQSEENE